MIEGHGDDSYKYNTSIKINFSSNVFAKTDTEPLKQHLSNSLDCISVYPEPEANSVRQLLATKHGISEDELMVTNGATESIYLIAQAFAHSNSAILNPTFSEYADACQLHQHKIQSIYHLNDIDNSAEMVWICNPNNPTGSVIEKDELIKLFKANPKKVFVIDQSYEYFTLEQLFSAKEAAEYKNVILLHSLTKHFVIAGLRIGYLTANESILSLIRSQRMPWSVNNVAIEAAKYLLNHPLGVDIVPYLEETQRLRKELNKLPILEVWETKTHFMLTKIRGGKASALKEYLAHEHGILIRDASNFEGLDNSFFRVATQTKEENNQLIKAIETWMIDY